MSKLAEDMRAFLIARGGERACAIRAAFPTETAAEFFAALDSVVTDIDDLGDDDCPKIVYYAG